MKRVLFNPRNTFFFPFFPFPFFFPSIRDWSNVKPSICHSFKGKLITLKQNARGWRIIDFLVVPCRHNSRIVCLDFFVRSAPLDFLSRFLILLDRSMIFIRGFSSKREESCNKVTLEELITVGN